MNAQAANTTAPLSEPKHSGGLVGIWARGRREYTPWAYPRLGGLAAVRFAVSVLLVGITGTAFAQGHAGWALVTMVGAALVFAIAALDFSAARYVRHHS